MLHRYIGISLFLLQTAIGTLAATCPSSGSTSGGYTTGFSYASPFVGQGDTWSSCSVDTTYTFTNAGNVVGFQYTSTGGAIGVQFGTYRVTSSPTYTLIGAYTYTATAGCATKVTVCIPTASQWAVQSGDVLGFCTTGNGGDVALSSTDPAAHSGISQYFTCPGQSGGCTNPTVPSVGGTVSFSSPSSSRVYEIRAIYGTGATCSASSGSVSGDPVFVAFTGTSFQVHGVVNAVYSIITTPTLLFNAQFGFLSEGRRNIKNKISTARWTHPGTYLIAGGLVLIDSKNVPHSLTFEAGYSEDGFVGIEYNDRSVGLDSFPVLLSIDNNIKIQITSHRISVETSEIEFTVVNSDSFFNIDNVALIASNTSSVHGLLGHSWKKRTHYPEGDVEDYSVGGLFDSSFPFSTFKSIKLSSAL